MRATSPPYSSTKQAITHITTDACPCVDVRRGRTLVRLQRLSQTRLSQTSAASTLNSCLYVPLNSCLYIPLNSCLAAIAPDTIELDGEHTSSDREGTPRRPAPFHSSEEQPEVIPAKALKESRYLLHGQWRTRGDSGRNIREESVFAAWTMGCASHLLEAAG